MTLYQIIVSALDFFETILLDSFVHICEQAASNADEASALPNVGQALPSPKIQELRSNTMHQKVTSSLGLSDSLSNVAPRKPEILWIFGACLRLL